MGVGGGGGRLFLYERRGNNGREAERNKAEEREAKRGRLLQTSSGGGKGREEQRTKEEEERKELPACILIKCISLLVMLEHSSELGFVGRVCVDATCCLPPAAAGAGSMRADELLLRYTLARTRICAHTYNNEHASTSF